MKLTISVLKKICDVNVDVNVAHLVPDTKINESKNIDTSNDKNNNIPFGKNLMLFTKNW